MYRKNREKGENGFRSTIFFQLWANRFIILINRAVKGYVTTQNAAITEYKVDVTIVTRAKI